MQLKKYIMQYIEQPPLNRESWKIVATCQKVILCNIELITFKWFCFTLGNILTQAFFIWLVREAVSKKTAYFLDTVLKEGGGGVQPESKSVEVFFSPSSYFDPLLDTKWGEGVDHVTQVLGHFLPKFWVNIWILGLYGSYQAGG